MAFHNTQLLSQCVTIVTAAEAMVVVEVKGNVLVDATCESLPSLRKVRLGSLEDWKYDCDAFFCHSCLADGDHSL
jgi:hypothetical protein